MNLKTSIQMPYYMFTFQSNNWLICKASETQKKFYKAEHVKTQLLLRTSRKELLVIFCGRDSRHTHVPIRHQKSGKFIQKLSMSRGSCSHACQKAVISMNFAEGVIDNILWKGVQAYPCAITPSKIGEIFSKAEHVKGQLFTCMSEGSYQHEVYGRSLGEHFVEGTPGLCICQYAITNLRKISQKVEHVKRQLFARMSKGTYQYESHGRSF